MNTVRFTAVIRLATVAALGLATAPAHAQTTFTFNFSSSLQSGTGTVTATNTGTYYQATSASGTITSGHDAGDTFTLVPDPTPGTPVVSADGIFTYDDQLFPTSSQLVNLYGLLLQTNSAGQNNPNDDFINLYSTGPNAYHADDDDYSNGGRVNSLSSGTFTLTPAPVPEPSTVVSLGVGGLGLLGLTLRARRRAA